MSDTANEAGFQAFEDSEKSRAGYSDRLNPYDAGTNEHRSWREGFERAYEQYFDI